MPIVARKRLPAAQEAAPTPILRPEIQPRARMRLVTPRAPANDQTASIEAPVENSTDAASIRPAADNDVGYGKPPKHSQFKPGQSGNPKGRPKGSKGLNTIVRETMTKKVSMRIGGKVVRVQAIEALVAKTTEQALTGNLRAAGMIMQKYDASVPDIPTSIRPGVAQPDDWPVDEHDEAILRKLRMILREAEDE